MIRFLGFSGILIGCCCCGLCIVRDRGRYVEECRQWLILLKMMENEIAFQKSPLPEICIRISGRLPEEKKNFLKRVGTEMQKNGGETLGEIWSREIRPLFRKFSLQQEIRERLTALGDSLCFEDEAMQRRVILDLEKELEEHMEKERQLNGSKNRLTLCMGVMCGILITILLL